MDRAQRQSGHRGTSTVEFIVVLPALLLVIFIIVELSRAWLTLNLVTTAAREGARVGSVTPTAAGDVFNPVPAQARVATILPGATQTVTCVTPCVSDSQVIATVTVTFQTLFPVYLPMLGSVNITQTAVMRYE